MPDGSTALVKSGKFPTFAQIQAALRGRKLDPLGKIADALDVPLWMMFVPGLSQEFFEEKRQHKLVRLVDQYVRGDDVGGALTEVGFTVNNAVAVLRYVAEAMTQQIVDDEEGHVNQALNAVEATITVLKPVADRLERIGAGLPAQEVSP